VKALLQSLPVLALTLTLHAHSAIEPESRGDAWWKERHQLLNERAASTAERAKVIFIGDSITQGWEGGGREVWERYYSHRHAVNLGISGDRTQHVLWRLSNGNLQNLRPSAAVVMIGTNNSNGEDHTVSQIADGIAAIVHKLRQALPDTKVLLVAIFPRGESPIPQRGKILMVNQVVRRLADQQHVFWIDFGHRYVDDQGLIPREFMPDFLHLSPKAYQIWAESIEPALSLILGDTLVEPRGASGGNP
jgi:lysophospholipase L1-like esterase